MAHRARLTLRQVFLLSILSLVVLMAVLFVTLLYGFSDSILQSADRLRREVGRRLVNQVAAFHDQAANVAENVETDMQKGLIRVYDPDALESALYEEVLNHPNIAEVTFTHSRATVSNSNDIQIGPKDHWQISAYRPADLGRIVIRRVWREGNQVFQEEREGSRLARQVLDPSLDPTNHLTFTTPVALNFDRPIWTDLHYSQLAGNQTNRIEVSAMKVVHGDRGGFLGVVRVGLLESQLNQIVAQSGDDEGSFHHVCFLCDHQGRLITPVTPSDKLGVDGDDLRIHSPDEPPEIVAAMAKVDGDGGEVTAAGKQYLVNFSPLPPDTQDWVLGVLAPKDQYLGGLIHTRNLIIALSLAVSIVIVLGGFFTLKAVQKGLSRLLEVTSRMRILDFAPAEMNAPFRDVQRVLDSLEQAKTAIRAMGKYVPMDLVRELYEMNREPVLGGELRELSIMFTDIRGFTSLSETLDPDRLAEALGQYLEVMTNAIHQHSGTIDKYIGDSVMALWNAPRLCELDARKACTAALACSTASSKLFASPAWKDLPPLYTRCGIHRGKVNVGHFGSPDRISYTALGDGVNLASRLEGLNKIYGTMIIVSEAIQQEVMNTTTADATEFHFRLLDRLEVVGKKQAVKVYELLQAPSPVAKEYESALAAYWRRDFAGRWVCSRNIPTMRPAWCWQRDAGNF